MENEEEISWLFSSARWSPRYSILAAFNASMSGVTKNPQVELEKLVVVVVLREATKNLST